jgi:hypothetical protein
MESALQYLVTATAVWWTAKKKDFRLKEERRNSPLPKTEITATSTHLTNSKERRTRRLCSTTAPRHAVVYTLY